MAGPEQRRVSMERLDEGVYLARNPRGGELRFGSKAGEAFTPTELLLAAIAGCSAVDIDVVTGRRSAADTFGATVEARVAREDGVQILRDIRLTWHITFPDGEAGDAARHVLPRAVAATHARTCTVSRTIESGSPITVSLNPPRDGA